MKNKFFFLFLFLFSAAYIQAESQQSKSDQQQYKNALGLAIDRHLPINGVYYFGKSNDWSIFVGVSPYSRTITNFGLEDFSGYRTTIGAGINKFFPIAPSQMGNKLFLRWGAYWHQHFGKEINNADIRSFWLVGSGLGLQYRLNSRVYIEWSVPIYMYSQARFREIRSHVLPVADNRMTRHWAIFSCSQSRLTFLF